MAQHDPVKAATKKELKRQLRTANTRIWLLEQQLAQYTQHGVRDPSVAAVSAVLSTTELLIAILQELSTVELFSSQKVCCTWRNATRTSPKLQRKMGFRTDQVTSVGIDHKLLHLHPLVASYYAPDHCYGIYPPIFPSFIKGCPTDEQEARRWRRSQAWLRPEASCRRLPLTRPAVTRVTVCCRHDRLPERISGLGPRRPWVPKTSTVVVTNPDGVTAGDVFDAAIRYWERWRGNEVVSVRVPAGL